MGEEEFSLCLSPFVSLIVSSSCRQRAHVRGIADDSLLSLLLWCWLHVHFSVRSYEPAFFKVCFLGCLSFEVHHGKKVLLIWNMWKMLYTRMGSLENRSALEHMKGPETSPRKENWLNPASARLTQTRNFFLNGQSTLISLIIVLHRT